MTDASRSCAECGKAISPEFQLCPYCGATQSMPELPATTSSDGGDSETGSEQTASAAKKPAAGCLAGGLTIIAGVVVLIGLSKLFSAPGFGVMSVIASVGLLIVGPNPWGLRQKLRIPESNAATIGVTIVLLALTIATEPREDAGPAALTGDGVASSEAAGLGRQEPIGTRQNPVPVGEAYLFEKGSRKYLVSVRRAVYEAKRQVKDVELFYEEPPAGHDYVLVSLALAYLEGPQDRPFHTETGSHRLYAGNRLWGAPILSGNAPEPSFAGQDIFPGATVEGWLPGKYLPINLMGEAVLVYDDVYFALPGPNTEVPMPVVQTSAGAQPESQGSAPLGSRFNPVPFGHPYTFERSGRRYTFTVTNVRRNANAMVRRANTFNDTPPRGHDYILVAARIDYLSGPEDKPFTTPSGSHRFYAGNRFWGAPSFGVPPSPRLDGQDIFPGATVSGWLAGKYLPTELMNEAVLVYNDVYFALR